MEKKQKLCYMDTDSFIVYKKKKKTSPSTLPRILKQDLILQIMNWKDHYLEEKIKKVLD